MVGFGRGRRRWKVGEKLGMELVREGWEPLWYGTLLLLHPAGQVPGTTLRDLKGITKGLVKVKWLRGGGCTVVW